MLDWLAKLTDAQVVLPCWQPWDTSSRSIFAFQASRHRGIESVDRFHIGYLVEMWPNKIKFDVFTLGLGQSAIAEKGVICSHVQPIICFCGQLSLDSWFRVYLSVLG